jgi:CheY-like chemotaxis protein
MAAGMNDYVSKPIDPRRLMEVLARQQASGRLLQSPA